MYCHDNHLLPEALPSLSPNNACSAFISTTTVALSLLLVFRTNAAYGRWDEARKMQGMLVNRSWDSMRQVAFTVKYTSELLRLLRLLDSPFVGG